MKVLVTGGAGYIGSVTATQLVAAGHTVAVLDNLSSGHAVAVPPRAELVTGNLADAAALRELCHRRGVEAVIHFAASLDVAESMQRPEKYFRNNVAGTLTLLEVLTELRIQRLVFSSSAAVYGIPNEIPIPESAEPRPVNPYGESKLTCERMLHWFHRIHGLRYAALRYFNAAGATETLGEHHEPEPHLIPRVLQAAAGLIEAVDIFGTDYPTADGTCVRDFIHVSDLADAHVRALHALDTKPAQVYNLGNGQGVSVRQVVDAAQRVTGREVPVRISPRRPGDPPSLVAGHDKIRSELGWQPRFSLDQIIASAWQWHRKFPAGYSEAVTPHRSTTR